MFTSTFARLGLVTVAAVIGLAAAAAPAGAEPPSQPEPPGPSQPATTEPPPASSTPPSGEPPPSSSSPPTSDEPKRLTVLAVSATFDKPAYRTGETMTIRFTVGNDLGERIDRIRVHQSETPDAVMTDYGSWGELNNAPGATIDAGGDSTFLVTGRVTNPAVRTAVLAGSLYDGQVAGYPFVTFSFSVPMTPSFGHAAGIVYDDRNHTAGYDGGEPGVAGARVRAVNSLYPEDEYAVVTGADGAFGFPPAAHGAVRGDRHRTGLADPGTAVHGRRVRRHRKSAVRGGAVAGQTFRGHRVRQGRLPAR